MVHAHPYYGRGTAGAKRLCGSDPWNQGDFRGRDYHYDDQWCFAWKLWGNVKRSRCGRREYQPGHTNPEEFYKITGKRELQEVLAGIRAAKTAGLPVKLNAVNRKELDPIPLVRYAQEENLPIRFIEMMPVGYGKKYVGRSNEELRETLEAVCGNAECMTNREELSRMGSGPAVYYQFSDLKVPVGFISAIHGKFCDTCNRVRLTAEGYLKLCLCYDEGEDLRRVLREGEKENLRTIMEQTIFRKPAAHCFEHPAEMTETHEMVKIGG